MFQQQVFVINMVLMVLDALCIILAGYGAHFIRSEQSYGLWAMDELVLSLSILFVMFVNNLLMGKVGLYSDRRITSYWKLAGNIAKALCVNFTALASIAFLFHQQHYSRAFLFYYLVLSFVFLFLLRSSANIFMNTVACSRSNARRMLVVGDENRGRMVVAALECQLSLGHQIAGHLAVEGNGSSCAKRLEKLPQLLKEKEIDEVVFAVPPDRSIDLKAYLDICSRMGIPARILPALWHPEKARVRVEQCQGIPFMTLRVNNLNVTGLIYKRLTDIAGALVGTALLLLMYPFVALAIKWDSPGPIFFKQERVGQNGRIFRAYKFRSMYVDAEERKRELMKANEMHGPMFKLKKDPRITRVGRFLRNTSLDEFPQFINVLKGEMSLVGTRPPTPGEVKQYDLPDYKRISAKPGITGLWQVSGRNKITDFAEVVRLDCEYLENWRYLTDLRILLKTCWVVLARKGAC